MVDNFRTLIGLRVFSLDGRNLLRALSVLFLSSLAATGLHAQTPSAAAAPNDAAAAAGMTTGTTETPSYRDLQMMQVRAAAQSAQGDASAASMTRSVDRTLEDKNREEALEEARKTKALKRDAANRMRWERSSNAYNKVTSDQMASWKTNTGNVRVERNVPDPFLISLIQEEEQLAARRAAEEEANAGPLKKAFGWMPFKGDDAPRASGVTVSTSDFSSASDGGGGGLFSKVRLPSLPKLPSIGSGGGADSGAASSGNSGAGEPSFAPSSSQSPAPRSNPAASTAVAPGTIPRISGAELVDGKPQVQRTQPTSSEPAFVGSSSSQAELPGQEEEEGGGLFSMFKSSGSSSSRRSGGGGLFNFGKKKSSGGGGNDGAVDGSLFPDNSVNESPTGGQLTGGYAVDDVSEDVSFASDTGSVELPGQEQEKPRKTFSLPKPSLSLPNIVKSEGSSGGGEGVPANTVVNSAGTNVYQVTDTAQFMVYGEDRMQSEVRALSAGTIVRMTKAGDQWASIQLSDGTEGIIKNEFLRASQ